MIRNVNGSLTPEAFEIHKKIRPTIVNLFREFGDRFSYDEIYLIINLAAIEVCNNAYILHYYGSDDADTQVT